MISLIYYCCCLSTLHSTHCITEAQHYFLNDNKLNWTLTLCYVPDSVLGTSHQTSHLIFITLSLVLSWEIFQNIDIFWNLTPCLSYDWSRITYLTTLILCEI
jgi:hypothetical protein